jgi:hypothetical protein
VKYRFCAFREGEVGHSRQDLFEIDVELEARQIGTQASMDSCTESEVPVLAAIEDAAIRLRELAGVAVGGGVVDHYGLPWAEGVPVEFDFPRDSAGNSVYRPGEANELFDGSW